MIEEFKRAKPHEKIVLGLIALIAVGYAYHLYRMQEAAKQAAASTHPSFALSSFVTNAAPDMHASTPGIVSNASMKGSYGSLIGLPTMRHLGDLLSSQGGMK